MSSGSGDEGSELVRSALAAIRGSAAVGSPLGFGTEQWKSGEDFGDRRDLPVRLLRQERIRSPDRTPQADLRADALPGVTDWSEAGPGDALYDLATLTLGHDEHLGDVVAGYGTDVDLDMIRAWWSWRSLKAARWLIEHGFDPSG